MIVGAPLKSFPGPLTSAEEKEYVKRLENGDRSARNVLNYLVEQFGIAPISTPEKDLKDILG